MGSTNSLSELAYFSPSLLAKPSGKLAISPSVSFLTPVALSFSLDIVELVALRDSLVVKIQAIDIW